MMSCRAAAPGVAWCPEETQLPQPDLVSKVPKYQQGVACGSACREGKI